MLKKFLLIVYISVWKNYVILHPFIEIAASKEKLEAKIYSPINYNEIIHSFPKKLWEKVNELHRITNSEVEVFKKGKLSENVVS